MANLSPHSRAVLASIAAHDLAINRRYWQERQDFWLHRAVDYGPGTTGYSACLQRADRYRAKLMQTM